MIDSSAVDDPNVPQIPSSADNKSHPAAPPPLARAGPDRREDAQGWW